MQRGIDAENSYQDYQLLSPLETTYRFIPLGIVGGMVHSSSNIDTVTDISSSFCSLHRLFLGPDPRELHSIIWSVQRLDRKPTLRSPHFPLDILFRIWLPSYVSCCFRRRYCISLYRAIHHSITTSQRPRPCGSYVPNTGRFREGHVSPHHCYHTN